MTTPQPQTARAAIYARVSSEEQREGQTIDSQIAELERFAGSQGWPVAGIYKDEGWSGAVLARPALDCLRDDASRKLFEVVLLNDVDRLARDVSHLGVIKRDLERHGVQVRFRKLPAEKSPTYNLMVNILGSFAEFEREMIVDRTRRGRRHKVEVRQQYMGSALTAYGYRYVPIDRATGREGRLEIIPEEVAVVRQMFDWVDHESLSGQAVLRRLNELRIPPKKRGGGWGKSSVLRILHNEMYAGIWHYGKYEHCEPEKRSRTWKYHRTPKTSLRLRERREWIPVKLPDGLRIIEWPQFQRVQGRLARNRVFSPRNSRHEYLLRGLLKCGSCGRAYVGDPGHGRFSYRCTGRCRKMPNITEEKLNTPVWQALREALLNPSIIIDQVRRQAEEKAAEAGKRHFQISELEAALEQVRREEERVLEAYRQAIITPSQLSQELSRLRSRTSTLEARNAELGRDDAGPAPAEVQKSVEQYCRLVSRRLDEMDTGEKQRLLRLLVEEIIFEGDRIRIRGIIPLIPDGELDQAEIRETFRQGDSAEQ